MFYYFAIMIVESFIAVQQNISMEEKDIYPKIVMIRGAVLALTRCYLESSNAFSLDEYLKHVVFVPGTIFNIPYMISNQYYKYLLDIVSQESFPEYDYINNNFEIEPQNRHSRQQLPKYTLDDILL